MDQPIISVIVVAYNMARELPRTLYSLSAAYQRHIPADDYEVIVVDNGSVPPVDPRDFSGLAGDFRFLRIDRASPSPAAAINRALREARGGVIGVMVDGARLVTPGLLFFAYHAAQLHPRAIVAPLNYYLGPDLQAIAVANGYDQTRENALLASIGWPQDGYRLFEIATPDESTIDGWFSGITESNALFLKRDDWQALGGFDERFDAAGGGLLNLDTYRRAMELPGARRVVPLGEASFHQVHGGIATNSLKDAFLPRLAGWFRQYETLRGHPYAPPEEPEPPIYIGTLPPPVLSRFVRAAMHPGRAGLTPPLGTGFDPGLWATAPPPLPVQPIAADLLSLAHAEFREGRYEATAAITRLAYARFPDEPEPQRLLSLVANYLPRGRELPAPELQGGFHLALGHAHRLLGDGAKALAEFRLAFDRGAGEAAAEIASLEACPAIREAADRLATLTIQPAMLRCHGVYLDERGSLRCGDALQYEADRHAAITEDVLFFGPYIAIGPGEYRITLKGVLDGILSLDFAHDGGRPLKEVTIGSFMDPVSIAVTKPIADFEVRGRRTAGLRTMRLEAIEVERVTPYAATRSHSEATGRRPVWQRLLSAIWPR